MAKRFGVERKCTCKPGQRGYDCATAGWHEVDEHDDCGAALKDACDLAREVGVPYRAVDKHTPVERWRNEAVIATFEF